MIPQARRSRRCAALDDPRVVVVHEPRAGVANARNAGLRAARGELIAFLDDDEIAPSSWLAELLRVQAAEKADVVFGPVRTKLSEPPRDHRAYFEAFFARDPDHAEGMHRHASMAAAAAWCAAPRCRPLNHSRRSATRSAARTICCSRPWMRPARASRGRPDAWVWETPEPSRVTLAYTLKRAFAYGQGPATKAWTGPKRDFPAIAILDGRRRGADRRLRRGGCRQLSRQDERRAFAYRRFVEGVGKVLWFPVIKPRFYGVSKLSRAERAAAEKAIAAA